MTRVVLIAKQGSSKHESAATVIHRLNMDYTLQAAIYRDQVPLRFPPNLREQRIDTKHKAGEYGCALAHVDCWRNIDATDIPTLILEDDIALSESADKTRQLLDQAIHDGRHSDIVFMGYWGLLTTHAYYLTPSGARTLLHGIEESNFVVPTPVDHHIRRLCKTGALSYSKAPNLSNTKCTEFDGIIKQVSARVPGGGPRKRFQDVI